MENLRIEHNDFGLQGRLGAIVLRIALVVVLLFPSAFIALEANHDCDGGDCAICQCLQAAETLLNSIGSGSCAAVALLAVALFALIAQANYGYAPRPFTLVCQKVRLDI